MTSLSPFGASESQLAALVGPRPDRLSRPDRAGVSRPAPKLQREDAGSTFITGATFQPVPVERTIAGYFVEGRWTAAASRPGHRRPAAGRHPPQQSRGIAGCLHARVRRWTTTASSRSTRRLAVGVDRARWIGGLHQAARIGRHRHPSSRRVRSRLHRQSVAEAGAQLQLRESASNRRSPAAGPRRSGRVLQQLRRPDRRGRIVPRVQPLHDRQHLERTGARFRALARWRASRRIAGATSNLHARVVLHLARLRGARGGQRRRRAAAVHRR